MSFLGDIVNSIGSNKPPVAQPRPPSRPSSANADRLTPLPKAGARPQLPSNLSGTKRKAEENLDGANGKTVKSRPITGNGNEARTAQAPPLNAPKNTDKSSPAKKGDTVKISTAATAKSPLPNTNHTTGAAPGPAKGSFADLMARAKEAAAQRPQGQVGGIRHQTTVKERPSKLAEKRRGEQEKLKAQKAGKDGKKIKSRSASPPPARKGDDKKDVKAPKSAPRPTYKGTMGGATSHGKPYQDAHAKKSRYDEYLGTDEEDDSDAEDEDGYDGYSDASSDMEAGFDDVEGEEMAALRAAKADDARELAIENRLKKEKEERRKRLEQIAAKRR
jgi:hypothetical protein